ncbi:MAG: AIR synthase-related protein, partial [Kiritimatiellae bacterium]|nr:AIR synthase-related protein [Kiritimatiellia bacterium]
AAVDEAVRQVLVTGANPDKIALLDNFCAGDPRNPRDLGPLVECLKGLSSAAGIFRAPFISGKDSFNNTYQSPEGTESIPLTLLTSSIGIIDDSRHITGASIRRNDSLICLLGAEYNPQQAVMNYQAFYKAVQAGCILSAHDISDGGLAVALAESAFSMKAGVEADTVQDIYAEYPGRIIFEINAADREQVEEVFRNSQLSILGHTTAAHRRLVIRQRGQEVVNEPLEELKTIWQNALKPWC